MSSQTSLVFILYLALFCGLTFALGYVRGNAWAMSLGTTGAIALWVIARNQRHCGQCGQVLWRSAEEFAEKEQANDRKALHSRAPGHRIPQTGPCQRFIRERHVGFRVFIYASCLLTALIPLAAAAIVI